MSGDTLTKEEPVGRCGVCNRATWDVPQLGEACNFPQPDGTRCNGRFIRISDSAPKDGEVCAWSRDFDGNDDTECGQTWCLEDGTPPENGMKFCPYCGRQIVWTDYVEEIDDEE